MAPGTPASGCATLTAGASWTVYSLWRKKPSKASRRRAPTRRPRRPPDGVTPTRYSHSMVPGGLLVTSSTTRFTSSTSFVMRVEIWATRS